MEPRKKPCGICGGTKNLFLPFTVNRERAYVNNMPVSALMCKTCTNITLFISIEDTTNHKSMSVEEFDKRPFEEKKDLGV